MKTYVKIEKRVLDKIEKLTNNDYNAENNFITTENLIYIIDDLLDEIYKLQDKISKLEDDLYENYRPVPAAEQVAISDNDFI